MRGVHNNLLLTDFIGKSLTLSRVDFAFFSVSCSALLCLSFYREGVRDSKEFAARLKEQQDQELKECTFKPTRIAADVASKKCAGLNKFYRRLFPVLTFVFMQYFHSCACTLVYHA